MDKENLDNNEQKAFLEVSTLLNKIELMEDEITEITAKEIKRKAEMLVRRRFITDSEAVMLTNSRVSYLYDYHIKGHKDKIIKDRIYFVGTLVFIAVVTYFSL